MATHNQAASHVVEAIKTSSHKKVKVAITDIDGILRGKYIHTDKFISASNSGFGFCNVVFGWDSADVCYDNISYTGWHSGYPDAEVRIDLSTSRNVPWDHGVPFFLGEFLDSEGHPLPICPRQLLKRVLEKAQTLGFTTRVGCEYEWFNFRETPQSLVEKQFCDPMPLTPGMFGYSILRSSHQSDYFNAIMDQLREFDVPLEGLHTETGPGVYEAAILSSDALEAADRAILFKTGVKEIAYRHNVVATFMARWNTDLPGTSGHIHQSLIHNGGKNAFYDATDSLKMSSVFKSFLAGQILCLPEILPMFAPTVNSYKRLVEGFWAPTSATWGTDNRTCAFRVISGGAHSTRVETRVAGADMNPYLAVAASLASGLLGIERGLKLEQPMVQGNAYADRDAARLSTSLIEATDRFHNSELARELFGADFVDHFSATREWEWRKFREAVTDWELKRYFEII